MFKKTKQWGIRGFAKARSYYATESIEIYIIYNELLEIMFFFLNIQNPKVNNITKYQKTVVPSKQTKLDCNQSLD